jgi:hypothetical protein
LLLSGAEGAAGEELGDMPIRWKSASAGVLLCLAGCCSGERPYCPPPPPNYRCKEVPFQDTAAFDGLLETHLSNRVPAIRILLDTPAPDWPPRLVAW